MVVQLETLTIFVGGLHVSLLKLLLNLAEMSCTLSDGARDSNDILDIFDKRRRFSKDALLSSMAILTMGHEGTIKFKYMHWEDDPESCV